MMHNVNLYSMYTIYAHSRSLSPAADDPCVT